MKGIVLITLVVALLLTGPGAPVPGAPAPMATPAPQPFDPWSSPPHELHKDGIPLSEWMALFLAYAEDAGLPMQEGGFQKVSEVEFTEHEGLLIEREYRYATYWMQVGGLQLFLRAFEDETMTDAYLYLDYTFEEDREVLYVQKHYLPEVMRACIHASERGLASPEDIELVMDSVAWLADWWIITDSKADNAFLLTWPEYRFSCETRAWGKTALFGVNWLR